MGRRLRGKMTQNRVTAILVIGIILCAEASIPAAPSLTQDDELALFAADVGDRGLKAVDKLAGNPVVKENAAQLASLLQSMVHADGVDPSRRVNSAANSALASSIATFLFSVALLVVFKTTENADKLQMIDNAAEKLKGLAPSYFYEGLMAIIVGALVQSGKWDVETLAFVLLMFIIIE